jgi:hypothetical protein
MVVKDVSTNLLLLRGAGRWVTGDFTPRKGPCLVTVNHLQPTANPPDIHDPFMMRVKINQALVYTVFH